MFPDPHVIRYDSHCFTIHDRDTFIFSAAMHYPRCPRELWRDRLTKLRSAGFNTIESYVFWNYHEREEGRCDLREFEDFIELVHELGFWMIVRPGPYVCAEWDAGGFPHWVVAKRFPLRSNHPESIRASQHWFDQVLPVIERHQITRGGPVILMQLENEYDYWDLEDSAKREYIDALARMAWRANIDVPLITCWTKQVRERSYPDMARIADFCNFYPRWNIVKEVAPGLEKLHEQETASPVGVVELQGGWFSEFGGKLSVDQDGIDAAQLNMLSKTAIEYGATFFSYYMGYGGTNFDWAGKRMTTSYDYAAPLREPGGLWEKYYAAREIGESLRVFGNLLARADSMPGGAESSNPAVSASLRTNGQEGMVFLRENANADQKYRLTFRSVNDLGARITVPRQGELVLGAREMKMLPAGVRVGHALLLYTTAEVLAHGAAGRDYVILYDKPGRLVEFAFAAGSEPLITGDVVYRYWDATNKSIVIGIQVGDAEKILLLAGLDMQKVDGQLEIILLPREVALRTWLCNSNMPHQGVLESMAVPFISDAALGVNQLVDTNEVQADFDFFPGDHRVKAFLPFRPKRCVADGKVAGLEYDEQSRIAHVSVNAPSLPAQPIEIAEVDVWVEPLNLPGSYLIVNSRPIEEILAEVPYGYITYRAEFQQGAGESKLLLGMYTDDAARVFVNGKHIEGTRSDSGREMAFSLTNVANPGRNLLEIIYEAFGSANFGSAIAELKGIESAMVEAQDKKAVEINQWQLVRVPQVARGGELGRGVLGGEWSKTALSRSGGTHEPVPAFTWCKASFSLQKPAENWSVPMKAIFQADSDALLYLNGKFVGRYVTIGPQSEFYLPQPYLIFDPNGQNILTAILAYTDSPHVIRTLRIAPYEEFSTYRAGVAFKQ